MKRGRAFSMVRENNEDALDVTSAVYANAKFV